MSYGQCSHDPVITADITILCPNEFATLETQLFDSYQWYLSFTSSNVGNPISGATAQTYQATEFGYYTVEATLNGCSEFSPSLLIDQWAFLPPAIAHDPIIDYCDGDSVLIQNAFGSYATYQWLRNGVPIPGATESSYWVKQSGTYVLNVTPFECPNSTLSSGVGPTYTFFGLIIPVITLNSGILTADPGTDFQWYFNGVEIPGATSSSYEPTQDGLYYVTAVDANGCMVESEEFNYTTVDIPSNPETNGSIIILQTKSEVVIKNVSDQEVSVQLSNLNGQLLKQLNLSVNAEINIQQSFLSKGIYVLSIQTKGNIYSKKILLGQ